MTFYKINLGGNIMLKLFIGDRKLIKQKIEKLAKQYNVSIRYSTNILYDLSKQYGLFYTPALLYFIFDPKEINDKDSVNKFKELIEQSKLPVVCIIETTLDKRSIFYKTFHKNIENLGDEKINEDVVTKFYKNMETIKTIDTKEAISFLYKIYYGLKQYKEIAGYCINLVLTGQVTTDLILKIFLTKLLDKY